MVSFMVIPSFLINPVLQERWYFLLVLLDAAGIAWVRTRRTFRSLLDILVALVGLLLDTETLRNKIYALSLMKMPYSST